MIGRSEVNKMNNYDRYLAVRDKLRQVHEAAFAVNEFRKRSAYFPGAVEAFKPGDYGDYDYLINGVYRPVVILRQRVVGAIHQHIALPVLFGAIHQP